MAATVIQRALLADLQSRVFGDSGRSRRVGAEIEWIPVDRERRRIFPVFGSGRKSSLGMLRQLGGRLGWKEECSSKGVPYFLLPGDGSITFEPGGQIEYSSPACRTASELLGRMRAVDASLRQAAAEAGAELLSVGIDPLNSLAHAPLQLRAERYSRMAEHFESVGKAGARMMRQTASLQIALDFDGDAPRRWKALNALAPYLAATFANSPVYDGKLTGHQSFREHCWRTLDPGRTGLPVSGGDPVQAYLDFALGAVPFLLHDVRDVPLGMVLERRDLTPAEWEAHLSTLFPEIRPRGYLEVRSIDAQAPEWYAAPIAFLAGIVYDRTSLDAALNVLEEPTDDLLARAGARGLQDPDIADLAVGLFELGLAGCRRLGTGFLAAEDYETARGFFDEFTRQGRCPADDTRERF